MEAKLQVTDSLKNELLARMFGAAFEAQLALTVPQDEKREVREEVLGEVAEYMFQDESVAQHVFELGFDELERQLLLNQMVDDAFFLSEGGKTNG